MRKELEQIKYAKFIEFCKDGDKTIKEICETFSIKPNQAYYRIRKFDLKYSKRPRGEKIRNETIIRLVKEDKLTYKEIGKMFGVTRQRIKAIGAEVGYSRWDERRKKFKGIAKNVNRDLELGLTYTEIRNKYSRRLLEKLADRNLIINIYTDTLNDRDKSITKKYRTNRAVDIINSNEVDLNNPNGIKSEGRVYTIASNNGFKKYPKIGRRCDGGTFEDKKILRYIEKKRDKNGWSFKEIAEKLTRLGHKTLTGTVFNAPNVYYKYYAYKKNKYKRLKY